MLLRSCGGGGVSDAQTTAGPHTFDPACEGRARLGSTLATLIRGCPRDHTPLRASLRREARDTEKLHNLSLRPGPRPRPRRRCTRIPRGSAFTAESARPHRDPAPAPTLRTSRSEPRDQLDPVPGGVVVYFLVTPARSISSRRLWGLGDGRYRPRRVGAHSVDARPVRVMNGSAVCLFAPKARRLCTGWGIAAGKRLRWQSRARSSGAAPRG